MTKPVIVNGPIPVLTFLTNFLIGGTERQVVNLVRNHDRSRFEVHLGCFRFAGPLLQEIDASAVALSEYPITTLPSARTLWQQGRLLRYIRQHRIRIVHSFGFYANVFATPVARLSGAELVMASIRDTGDHLTPLQKAMQKWACRTADHILVNAEAVRRVLVDQGYEASRISVIRNGIDVSRFRNNDESTAIRTELGFPPKAPVVAVFARLNRLKGIEYFLEAAAVLSVRFDDARFLIVGDSISEAYRLELEEHAKALGLGRRVVFTGFRSDIPELLREVSVSVLPSLAEGLSNVILEAMAAGVSVVATAVGGTPEVIEDGVSGLLVPPRDASALARAIGSLLGEPERRRTIGLAGQRQVIERFSLEATVLETEKLYERLLLAGRRRGSAKALLKDRGPVAPVRISPPGPPLGGKEW
jgi:glycosyltransferase involved in cell wall biosynthesis